MGLPPEVLHRSYDAALIHGIGTCSCAGLSIQRTTQLAHVRNKLHHRARTSEGSVIRGRVTILVEISWETTCFPDKIRELSFREDAAVA